MLSLLIGREVVEGLGLDIRGSSKTLEYNGRSPPSGRTLLCDSFTRAICRSSDPPTSWVPCGETSTIPFVPASARGSVAAFVVQASTASAFGPYIIQLARVTLFNLFCG